jgi:hypothetical protein
MFKVFLVTLLFSSSAWAGNSTAALAAFFALGTEATLEMQSKVCALRIPESKDTWAKSLSRFKQANAQALSEITAVAASLGLPSGDRAPLLTEQMSTKALVAGSFILISATNSAYDLAVTNDANSLCTRWLDRITEGGILEKGLPHAVEQAKTLLGGNQKYSGSD